MMQQDKRFDPITKAPPGMRRMAMPAVLAVTLAMSMPAAAQTSDGQVTAGVVTQLYACRAISDPTERLACFDRQVAALETAQQSNDVRIVDREQVREARRGLFGLRLPSLSNLFGDNDEEDAEEATVEEEGITYIESSITSISSDGTGRRVLVLENGQHWVQIEPQRGRAPRAGQAVIIRRGLLGSYVATVNESTTVRVMRLR